MTIIFDPRVEKWLKTITVQEKSYVKEYIDLFIEFGFGLSQKYLKKIDTDIWELRPKTIRLFLTKVKFNQIVIHGMHKKSQRITKETMMSIKQRAREYKNENNKS